MSDEGQMRVLRRLPRWWPVLALAALLGLSVLVIATTTRGKKAPQLPWFLEDLRTKARLREIQGLRQRTDADAIRRLLALGGDRNAEVRRAAGEVLRRISDPRAVENLIGGLKDTEAYVRWGAAGALGDINDPRAVGPLIAALKDTDAGVRGNAAWALRQIGDPRAAEPLIAALKDIDRNVRLLAAGALAAITGVDYGEDAEKWQKWWEENKGKFKINTNGERRP